MVRDGYICPCCVTDLDWHKNSKNSVLVAQKGNLGSDFSNRDLTRFLWIPNILLEVMIKLGIYEHYSGKRYEVIGIVKHSETLSDMVVYKPLYKVEKKFNNYLWARPMKMFLGRARINGKLVQRFKKI